MVGVYSRINNQVEEDNLAPAQALSGKRRLGNERNEVNVTSNKIRGYVSAFGATFEINYESSSRATLRRKRLSKENLVLWSCIDNDLNQLKVSLCKKLPEKHASKYASRRK